MLVEIANNLLDQKKAKSHAPPSEYLSLLSNLEDWLISDVANQQTVPTV